MSDQQTVKELQLRVKKLEQKIVEQTKQVEDLKRSAQTYRDLVQSANSIMLRLDTKGNIRFINAFAQRFLDFSADEILGKNIVGTIVPEADSAGQDLVASIQHLIQHPEKYITHENENMRKNGERVWVAWTNKAIRDGKGQIAEILCIGNDISERKQAERAQRESEEKFHNVVESSPMGIHLYSLESDGRLVFTGANPAADVILGVNNKQFVGKTIEEAFPLLIDTEVPERYRQICTSGEPWKTEQIDYADKQIKGAFEVYAFQTEPANMATMFLDINERKQAEDALRESEEEINRLAAAVEQATESIMVTDRKGLISYVNPALEKISGFSREEMIGQNFRILKSDKHDESFYKKMWHTISGGNAWTGHIINRMKDNRLREFETTISPIRDRSGNITSFVSVNRDVTQEVALEEQLRQAQKMEAIGTLAGGIAHDFNNILSAIMGYTELSMLEVDDDSRVKKKLNEICRAGERAIEMVKQILAFSRQNEQERKPVLVGSIVRDALKMLRASLPTTIRIRLQIESDHGITIADPTEIHQVIMNLCTNAAHAMRNSGGELIVGLIDISLNEASAVHAGIEPGEYLRLSVRDTGHGISADVLEKIFDPYFTTKEKGQGTGMGLAVVHGIIKSHGGAISVESAPGEGSTFNVLFRRAEKEVMPDTVEPEVLPTGTEKILFVDDEQALVEIGTQLLTKLGYKVTGRTSSVEAYKLFQSKSQRFDLVITDMTMPNMSGDRLAREIQKIRPELPIILCTGYSERMSAQRAKEMGIKAFILEPIVIKDLAHAVREALSDE